eukprot:6464445-Amphidinium_carterae.4
MLLAMQGTPWDAKGRLATPVPMMGGMQATPVTATASSGGAEGSTTRSVDESPAVAPDVPEDVPEDGEPDVEGALTRPEKRARRRPRKRLVTASGASDGGTASGSVPGVTRGSTPESTSLSAGESARESTVRRAETLDEDDQAARKFVRLADEEECGLSWYCLMVRSCFFPVRIRLAPSIAMLCRRFGGHTLSLIAVVLREFFPRLRVMPDFALFPYGPESAAGFRR